MQISHKKNLAFRLTRLPLLFVFLLASGCATNHVDPEFEMRLSGAEKITGLIVRHESIGLEWGGLKHVPISEDETVMYVAKRGMTKLFSEQQLQQMRTSPSLHLPGQLIGLGYDKSEAERDTKLLTGLLKSAISNPKKTIQGNELETVRRLASRTGGDIVLLGNIRINYHISEESRSFADFLSILAAAGGQYGVVPMGQNTAVSLWAIIDPGNGNVLRALEDTMRY